MKFPFFSKKPKAASRSYEAGSASPRWNAAFSMPAPASTAHANASTVASRALYAVANIPLAANLAEVYATSLFPDAPTVRSGSEGYDDAFAATLAANLPDLTLIVRSSFIHGEGLGLLRMTDSGVRVRALNPEQLDRACTLDNPLIRHGVELDNDGEVVAYHIRRQAPDLSGYTAEKPIRVPANQVLHLFRPRVAGQVRGISELAPVLTRLNEMTQLQVSLLARANTAAMFGGFVRDINGEASQLTKQLDITMEPGLIQQLPPGADITFPTVPNQDGGSELLKSVERSVCAGVGIPYELATGDLSGTNYSSGKLGIEGFRRTIRLRRAALLDPMLLKVHAFYAAYAVLAMGLKVDKLPTFIWPDFASLEPMKEAQCDALLLKSGLASRAELIARRGRDIADVDREIAADTRIAPTDTADTKEAPTNANS